MQKTCNALCVNCRKNKKNSTLKIVERQRGLTPLIVVILVALVIGGYLIYQKQIKPIPISQPVNKSIPASTVVATSSAETIYVEASQSASWKTYTNDPLGISFKYPQNYNIKQITTKENVFFIESTDESLFRLAVYDNPNNLSLKDYEDRNKGESGMGPFIYYPKAQLVSFGNLEAHYTNEEVTCFSKCGSYVWVNKDKIFKLSGSNQNKPDQKQILDQILSTFKFTQ